MFQVNNTFLLFSIFFFRNSNLHNIPEKKHVILNVCQVFSESSMTHDQSFFPKKKKRIDLRLNAPTKVVVKMIKIQKKKSGL